LILKIYIQKNYKATLRNFVNAHLFYHSTFISNLQKALLMSKAINLILILLLCSCSSSDHSESEKGGVENVLGDFTVTEYLNSPAYIAFDFSTINSDYDFDISNRQLYIDLTFNWTTTLWRSSNELEVTSKNVYSASIERIYLSIYQTLGDDQQYHVEDFENLEIWAGGKHTSILNDYINRNGFPISHLFKPGTAYEDFYNTEIRIVYTISNVTQEVTFHLADLAHFSDTTKIWTDHNPTLDNLYLSWVTEAENSKLNLLIYRNDLDSCEGASIDFDLAVLQQDYLVTPGLLNTYCPGAMTYRYSVTSQYNLDVEASSDVIAKGTVVESIQIEGTVGEPSAISVE